MNKVICMKCQDMVEYITQEIKDTAIIKGKEIVYNKKVAFCKDCKKEVWVAELDDFNAIAPAQQYCKENNLITISEIDNLLKKYDIGQKPLSLLLDWGETTIVRFMQGQIPTKEYSKRLKELDSPIVFLQLLSENKENITDAAYKRTIKKINLLIKGFKFVHVLSNKYSYDENYYNISKNNYGGVSCTKQLCLY